MPNPKDTSLSDALEAVLVRKSAKGDVSMADALAAVLAKRKGESEPSPESQPPKLPKPVEMGFGPAKLERMPIISESDDDDRSTLTKIGDALASGMAEPRTGGDFLGLVGLTGAPAAAATSAVGDIASATASGAKSAAKITAGPLDKIGTLLDRAGSSDLANTLSKGGGIAELLRGDVKGAVLSAVAPRAMQATGRAMETTARKLSGLPNDAGMLEAIYDAATRGSQAIKLSPKQAEFLVSASERLIEQGRALTVGQREWLKSIYRSKIGTP